MVEASDTAHIFLRIISSEKEKVAVVEEVSKHLMKNAGLEEE